MANLRNSWNRLTKKQRFVVSRLFIHLTGSEITPLLGHLNQALRTAIAAEGDLEVMGESLCDLCGQLLDFQTFWHSAANEGDVCWQEGEANDYFTELFTDSERRYQGSPTAESDTHPDQEENLAIAPTHNLVVMITVAATGEIPELETDLADYDALARGLKTLINLHHQERLRGIQIHFSPAQLGDVLSGDQVLMNFPELIVI